VKVSTGLVVESIGSGERRGKSGSSTSQWGLTDFLGKDVQSKSVGRAHVVREVGSLRNLIVKPEDVLAGFEQLVQGDVIHS